MSFLDSDLNTATSIIGDIATPYALISQADRYIDTIIPDVTVREIHNDEDTITVHPVETGTPISDHVFANPKLLEIVGGFSDSTGGTGYVQQSYEAFLALKARRESFDVSTGKRFYENMLIAGISVITDERSEYVLNFVVRLQEAIITSTSSSGGAASGPSGGTQDSQADPAATAPESNVGNQAFASTTNLGQATGTISGSAATFGSYGLGGSGLGSTDFSGNPATRATGGSSFSFVTQ